MTQLFQFISNKWHLGTWFSVGFTWFSAENLEGTIKIVTMIVGLIAGIIMLLKLWNEYRLSAVKLKEAKEELNR